MACTVSFIVALGCAVLRSFLSLMHLVPYNFLIVFNAFIFFLYLDMLLYFVYSSPIVYCQ